MSTAVALVFSLLIGAIIWLIFYLLEKLVNEVVTLQKELDDVRSQLDAIFAAPECEQLEPPLVASPGEVDAVVLEQTKRAHATAKLTLPGSTGASSQHTQVIYSSDLPDSGRTADATK